jgi:hypothetical protein
MAIQHSRSGRKSVDYTDLSNAFDRFDRDFGRSRDDETILTSFWTLLYVK